MALIWLMRPLLQKFLQGGATTQFATIPMNLLRGKTKADYIWTGAWGKKAISEAKKYCEVNVSASSEADKFTTIPQQPDLPERGSVPTHQK